MVESRMGEMGRLLGAIVIVLAIGVWAWRSSGGGSAEPLILSPRSGVESGSAKSASFPLPVDPGLGARESRRASAPEPSTVAPSRFTPWPDQGALVVIRDGVGGKPVPRAEVTRFGTRHGGSPLMLAEESGEAIEEVFARFGTRYQADGEGLVRLPLGGCWLEGSAPGRWGCARVQVLEKWRRSLELHPEGTLVITVVDRFGLPRGGVPVEVQFRGRRVLTGMSAVSGVEDGVVRFSHVPAHAARGRAHQVRGVLAVLTAADEAAATEWFDVTKLPSAPVPLTAPALGRLEVHLLDSDGERLEAPARVLLIHLTREVGEDGTERFVHGEEEPSRSARVAGGEEPLVAMVALGETINVGAEPESGYPKQGQQVTVTPSTRVELRFRAYAAVLNGRFLDADDRPLALEQVRAVLYRGAPEGGLMYPASKPLRTDFEGCFRFPLPASREFEATWAELAVATVSEPGGVPCEARAAIELPSVYGDCAIGDLRGEARPLLFAGRVVDEGGRPVAGASIEVQRHFDTVSSSTFEVRPTSTPAPDLLTKADDAGHFVVYGREDGFGFTAHADHRDFSRGGRVSVSPGQEDVVLEIRTTGEIRGSLVTAEGIEARDYLVVEAEPEGSETARPVKGRVRKSDTFVIGGVSAGRHTVVVRGEGMKVELVRIPGVLVETDETTTDPRLQRIDLRDRLLRYHLEVVDSAGAPADRAEVRYRTAGAKDERYSYERADLQGQVEFVAPGPAVDIRVLYDDHRLLEMEDVGPDRRVVLERGIPVRLVIAHPRSSIDEFQLVLTPLAGLDQRRRRLTWSDFPSSATAHLPEPGRYQVGIGCWDTGIRIRAGAVEPEMIEVLDRETEQSFSVECDWDVVEEVVRDG